MHQGYKVRFKDYNIGGENFHIRSLLDKQQYWDPEGIAGKVGISSGNWSLFGVIWPSGQMLARHMSSYTVNDLRILEVGCGLALASLVLKRRGADITVSDYHPEMSGFLKYNTGLNDLADIGTMAGNWESDESTSKSDDELFDLIIGSDILYERDHFSMLSAFIDRHAKPDAEIVIVDPNRGYIGKFNRRMQMLGYMFSEVRAEETLADDEAYRGRILTYNRVAA